MLGAIGLGGGEIFFVLLSLLVFLAVTAGIVALVFVLIRRSAEPAKKDGPPVFPDPSAAATPQAPPVAAKTQVFRKCPQCGGTLQPDVPEGLCPACLLQHGIATEGGVPPGTPPFVPPTIPDLARLFPQLEILELVGKGGMGAVYKARQPALDRFVALKILAPRGGSDLDFAGRFTREARALARLSHPNIVGVYDFGQIESLSYFIMEFVDGPNLRQAGKLAPREALEIIPQICAALQFAHDEGIVHRDIKPENVLLDRKGRVKIADFGLAKILGQEQKDLRLTGERDVMGTPHYMAPEQVERPQEVDHRADIYSLGVVFYEMLTGELPLGKFQSPSQKVQVDVRLDEVVLRSLAKEPDLRYQHVSEMGTRVETIAQNAAEPVRAEADPAFSQFGWEYKSGKTIFGIPLLHVTSGMDPKTGSARVSRGIFAFGGIAKGVVAVGGRAYGGFAFGGIAAGLFACGGVAIGGVAIGGLTLALVLAVGGMAIGSMAVGEPGLGFFHAHIHNIKWQLLALCPLLLGVALISYGLIHSWAKAKVMKTVALPRGPAQFASPVPPPDRFWRRFAVVMACVILIPMAVAIIGVLAAMAIPAFVKGRQQAQQAQVVKRWQAEDIQRHRTEELNRRAVQTLSFGPVQELNPQARQAGTNSFLDLDTGRLLTLPPEIASGLAAVKQNSDADRFWQGRDIVGNSAAARYVTWLQENGVDLMFDGRDEIIAFDGVLAVAHGPSSGWNDWDGLSPDQAEASLQAIEKATRNIQSGITSIQPASGAADTSAKRLDSRTLTPVVHLLSHEQSDMWYFKTREGGRGILQIISYPDRQTAGKIRYKQVQNQTTLPEKIESVTTETWSPMFAPGEKPDLQKVLDEAKELMSRGRYDEALQRHLWHFNHASEYGDSYQNIVRMTTGVPQWEALGRRYPKAKQALLEIRDQKTRELAEGRGYCEMLQDVQAINHELQNDDATYALFQVVREKDPKVVEQCYYHLEDLLVAKGEYQWCLDRIGDPQGRFNLIRHTLELDRENQKRTAELRERTTQQMAELNQKRGWTNSYTPPDSSEMMRRSSSDRFVGKTRQLIEILVGAGHPDEAEKIRDLAVAVLDDARLKSAIRDAEVKVQKNSGPPTQTPGASRYELHSSDGAVRMRMPAGGELVSDSVKVDAVARVITADDFTFTVRHTNAVQTNAITDLHNRLAAVENRFAAARAIDVTAARDAAMATVVREAALAGNFELTKTALTQIAVFTPRDAAALEAARILARAGMRSEALALARTITSTTQRDAALTELAK